MDGDDPAPTIKIVGPCKSGKSTLAAGLQSMGIAARTCAQEHSDVPTMWLRIAPADILVALDVSLETIRRRVERSDWSEDILRKQYTRLAHARAHADLVIVTDELTPGEVLDRVMAFLRRVHPELLSE